MFSITKISMNHFLDFFKSEEKKEEEFKDFLKAEYKKDWQAALAWYKEEGTLPNFIRRTL